MNRPPFEKYMKYLMDLGFMDDFQYSSDDELYMYLELKAYFKSVEVRDE